MHDAEARAEMEAIARGYERPAARVEQCARDKKLEKP
jgi:hypothetical protein